MFSSPLFENNMFNTLAFFKKMQNVGMTQEIAEELALTFLNINNNQFENLVNKQDFSKFEIEIKSEIAEIKSEIAKIKSEIAKIKSEIAEIKLDMKNFVTKQEFFEFKNEIKSEMENFITKKEFYAEMKNLSLNLTVKMGIIMTTGIGALGLLIKL
jgi:predicted  nucleic acid-binding Zn-ribbon protein